MKSQLVAGLLSLIQPGVGHLYVRRPARALGFFALHLGLVAVFFSGFGAGSLRSLAVSLLIHGAFRLGAALDGARIAATTPKEGAPWYSSATACMVLLLGLGFVFMPVVDAFQAVKSFQAVSSNMEPALWPGDHLIVDLGGFRDRPPQRGQIVVLRSPANPSMIVIQRIVGVGGDRIAIRDKELVLNGEPQVESWAQFLDERVLPYSTTNQAGRRDNLPAFEIPQGWVFVMGDNRDMSFDSRWFGPVPHAHLIGAARYIYWSRARSRIGTELHLEP